MSATSNVMPFPLERRRARPLVSVAGLMQAFGYSERWWRYRISEGMPRHTWGKRHRFDPLEAEKWLEERYGA